MTLKKFTFILMLIVVISCFMNVICAAESIGVCPIIKFSLKYCRIC